MLERGSGDTGRVIVEDERPESDIRKRAAWLLAMLALVAGLFVLLSVTLFGTSGDGGKDHGDGADPTPGLVTSATPATSASTSASSSAAPTTSASAAAPTPSCPGNSTCAVKGDVSGAMSAINAYRSEHGKQAVPTTSTSQAERCAMTDGDDCPSSFVWVRVSDVSGSGVVTGVRGFHSDDDLLDDSAKSFEVGWAYDPGSRTLSCALIRND